MRWNTEGVPEGKSIATAAGDSSKKRFTIRKKGTSVLFEGKRRNRTPGRKRDVVEKRRRLRVKRIFLTSTPERVGWGGEEGWVFASWCFRWEVSE